MKYALDPNSGVSEADKAVIRQAEAVSQNITRGFYVYAVTDVMWSVRNYKRYYGHNIHTYRKMM